MVGDLWYGVATQGMAEGRRPGFEPQSEGERKKSARGSAREEKKKGSRGSAKVQTTNKAQGSRKSANRVQTTQHNTSKQTNNTKTAKETVQKSEKAQGGVQILKRLKVECTF
jgi:hypothetical protein